MGLLSVSGSSSCVTGATRFKCGGDLRTLPKAVVFTFLSFLETSSKRGKIVDFLEVVQESHSMCGVGGKYW